MRRLTDKIIAGIIWVDFQILFRIEKGCHLLQRLTGIDSTALARSARLIQMWLMVKDMIASDRILRAMLVLVFLDAAVSFFVSKKSRRFGEGIYMNERKITGFPGRVLYLHALPLSIFHDIWFSRSPWFEVMGLAAYLEAVDDLPPGQSKLKQWVNSLLQPRLTLQPTKADA